MTTRLGGLTLPNPVLTASGCAAAGRELGQFFDVAALGAVVTKSIMLRAAVRPGRRRGWPRRRAGMLNSIGLQGPGIDAFLEHDLPWLRRAAAPAPWSRSPAAASRSTPSWPGGCAARPGWPPSRSTSPAPTSRTAAWSSPATRTPPPPSWRRCAGTPRRRVPVLAKLSPDVTDIVDDRPGLRRRRRRRAVDDQHAARHGASTPTRMRPVLAGVTGGLSGPAIRPVAVRCVWQVHAGAAGRADPRAWAASAPAATRSSSCSPARARSRSAPRSSTTRRRPSGCSRELRAGARRARLQHRCADAVGHAHRPPTRSPDRTMPVTERPCAPDRRRAGRRRTSRPPSAGPRAVGAARQHREGRARAVPAARPRRGRCRAAAASGGRDVFLDLKLHDIPNTVAGAARSVADLAPDYLTVHASGGAGDGPRRGRRAARHAHRRRHGADVAVRRATSTPSASPARPRDAVRRLAVLAVGAGARALVCSPHEVAAVRREVGPDITLITPGVRPAGADSRRPGAGRDAASRRCADGADLLVDRAADHRCRRRRRARPRDDRPRRCRPCGPDRAIVRTVVSVAADPHCLQGLAVARFHGVSESAVPTPR